MAGIRLEWAQFGDFDGFDVLRSEAPMDINSLPSPIATNLPTMYHVDTTVVDGATYYYRVVAWRDAVSQVSGEIQLRASSGDPHWDKVVALLHFNGDLNDEKGRVWTANQPLQFGTGVFGASLLRSSSALNITTPASTAFVFDGDFTIEAFLKNTGATNPLFVYGDSQNNFIPLYLDSATSGRVFVNGGNLIAGINLPSGYFHYALTRKDGVVRAFVNGVAKGVVTYGSTLGLASGKIFLCSGNGYYDTWTGQIDELRITKGVARYTENFIPPDAQFPSY